MRGFPPEIRSPSAMLRRVLRRARGACYLHFPSLQVTNKAVAGPCCEIPDEGECLVTTKNGLYYLGKETIRRLMEGLYYGLCRWDSGWLVFQAIDGTRGRVVKFDLVGERIEAVCQVISGLSPGCHQMDRIDDLLYITDTYNNRLLVYGEQSGKMVLLDGSFPPGRLANGRQSRNYADMNSVWMAPDRQLYVYYHNETSKTGRTGQIAVLSPELKEIRRHDVESENGHNVVFWQGDFVFCDSMGGRLRHGKRTVYESDMFTRGLAMGADFWVVGESEYGEREVREKLLGRIRYLDRSFNVVNSIALPGMVQEVRLLGYDYCQSACAAAEAVPEGTVLR